jgi:hypothetical protein
MSIGGAAPIVDAIKSRATASMRSDSRQAVLLRVSVSTTTPGVFDPKIAPQKAIGILCRPRYEVPVGPRDQKLKFGTERLRALRQRDFKAIASGEIVRIIVYCSSISIDGDGKLIPFPQQPVDRQQA